MFDYTMVLALLCNAINLSVNRSFPARIFVQCQEILHDFTGRKRGYDGLKLGETHFLFSS
jgi:hypothetical protein